MIAEIRSYFNRVIRSIDSDLKHDGSPDLLRPIALTALDRTYKFEIGNIEPILQDSSFIAAIPVTLIIFKRLSVDEIDSYDKAFCKAINIHAKLQDKKQLELEPVIANIICNSIKAEAFEDNDNAYSFTLEFIVTTAYKYQD